VPPMPRRGGILAKSENNLTIVASYSPLLPRHSSLIWHTQGGEISSSPLVIESGGTQVDDTKEDIIAVGDPSPDDIVCAGDQQDNKSDKENISQIDDSENQKVNSDSNNNDDEKDLEEGKNAVQDITKIDKFKKVEKHSLIRSALERLSLRSKRKKDKNDKVKDVIKMPKKDEEKPKDYIHNESPKDCPQENKEEEDIASVKTKEATTTSTIGRTAPTSSTYVQSRPITHLEAALKDFQMSTAKSRESLSIPISEKSSLLLRKTEPRQCKEVITTTKCWRQKPPPVNNYLENTWRTLSSSMMDIHKRGEDNAEDYENVCKDISKDKEDMDDTVENVLVETHRISKAKSMNVLDIPTFEKTLEVQSTQLTQLNKYQKRVQASMERLNVSSWYKSPALSPPVPTSSRLGKEESNSSPAGWRRHISHSESRTSTLSRNSTPLSSQRYRSRFSTLPSSVRSASTASMNSASSTNSSPRVQMYLGWRSQERLDIGPAYLTSPAQRLASSVVPRSPRTEVTEADKDKTVDSNVYEKNQHEDKPPMVKIAWPPVDNESDDDSDVMDDDSGIDRSDDFLQEIINEA